MKCGTCGSTVLRLWSTFSPEAGRCIWIVQCGDGHLYVPTLNAYYTFTFADPLDAEIERFLEETQ